MKRKKHTAEGMIAMQEEQTAWRQYLEATEAEQKLFLQWKDEKTTANYAAYIQALKETRSQFANWEEKWAALP